jgi:hypothetical protein
MLKHGSQHTQPSESRGGCLISQSFGDNYCPNGFTVLLEASRSGPSFNSTGATSKLTTTITARFNFPAAVPVNMASEDHQYHPKDAVKAAINGTMITGAAGALVSAIQNTLTKRNVSAWGVFTRTGGTIAVFGASYAANLPFQLD